MFGVSFKVWKEKIKSNKQYENTQTVIISNSLSVIPIELAEIYPAGQHEGIINIEHKKQEKSILLSTFGKFLSRNINQFETIKILIPETYVNEYKVQEQFYPKNHLINYIEDFISEHFPEIKTSVIQTLEDL